MILNKEEIKKIIPYQEPFLFVDGVEEIKENKIFGFYQTSKDDYYFKGHFVDFKIMPGVLIVEAMAQLSSILLRKKIGENHKDYHFLAYEVKSVQFLKPIFPGEKIDMEAEVLAIYSLPDSETKIARIKAKAFVNKDLKCEARFSVAIIKKEEFEEKYKGRIK
jgi:3-hydroxyacyl-[acyl-carrier-protein] dehydratase/UDP-3-O-[3-hydroxymyristoyl] N-acetylglucosamine deacetylase/3-hydroxyacyl-[acyl-carrier-protein] dehydratase